MIPKIKFCGLKLQSEVDFCVKNDVDFVGFVFCESSPRNLDLEQFVRLRLGNLKNTVAVFKEARIEEIAAVLNANRVDFIQIHGEVPQELIGNERVIKAFSGEHFTRKDFLKYNFCKYFLFDGVVAGSGLERNFSFAQNVKNTTAKPFFLAGGINANNIHEALNFTNMIDISSGIEEVRGVKSLKLMEDIVKSFR